jgi:hypothetical protein
VTDVGDPDAAYALGRQLRAVQEVCAAAALAVATPGAGVPSGWHGAGKQAYAQLVAGVARDARVIADAADDAASALGQLGGQLDSARFKAEVLGNLQHAVDVATAVAAAQLFLDPIADAAATAAELGARAALGELRHLVESSITGVVAQLASRQVVLATVQELGRFALPRLAVAGATEATVDTVLGGHPDPLQIAEDAALAVLLPGKAGLDMAYVSKLPQILKAIPQGLRLAVHEGAIGHTIARHVRKQTRYLLHRLRTEGKSMASTFRTKRGAQRATNRCIAENIDAIHDWSDRARVGSQKQFHAAMPPGVRCTAFRIDQVTGEERRVLRHELDAVTVTLRKTEDGQLVVVTAYARSSQYESIGGMAAR